MHAAVTQEDAAIQNTLARMREIPCCERTTSGCFRRHGECACSCEHCLCAYVAFQLEHGDTLLSRYLPQLGYAVLVEILESSERVEGGEIVALIAPGRVWFPETSAGWISLADDLKSPLKALPS